MIETEQPSLFKGFLDKHLSGESIEYQKIFSIFLPILVDQAFIFGLNILNTAMISSSGVAAISAVSMVDSLNIFLVSIFVALSTGGTVVVAQYKGTENNKMVSKAAAGSISSVFILAFTLSVVAIVFHGSVLTMLFGRAEADVFSNARIYLIGCSLSYCGIATEEAVCGALRGVGETKSSLILSLYMNFAYMLLNVLFINTFHMGVLGMVISLNIARYTGGILALLYISLLKTQVNFHIQDALHFNWTMLKRIYYVGIPFAAEQLFFNGGKILTQTFVVRLGTYALAANAISGSISSLYQITGNSFSLTLITVVGQCMGRRNIRDSKKFTHSFIFLSSASFVLTAAIIFSLFKPLVSLYNPPEQIVHTIFIIVLILSIFQITIWSFSFITPSALRAAGDSRFTSIASMLSMWFVRVVLGYILGIMTPLGIIGIWLAMNLEWCVRAVIFNLRLHGDKWYKHHVID
ncbi:MAG: MATE family efflux transporter [Bacillota bacterium]|nr:MATE family efflux transporter [Bacillota bacterium]